MENLASLAANCFQLFMLKFEQSLRRRCNLVPEEYHGESKVAPTPMCGGFNRQGNYIAAGYADGCVHGGSGERQAAAWPLVGPP